ncbi:hypothetical protein [Nocardia abscessus]|uniref:hypothetical protein n=1 Tax=Nocardia abscessus TaxID=120957 RepID=UPI0024547709|nr:hypothetical protein [Nocardia abscessus]
MAIDRIWTTGAPFHARKKFTGYRLVASDAEWAAGEGPIITGPVAALLLILTGRRRAWDEITGDGATLFAEDARP